MANSRLAHRASFFAEVDVLSPAEAMPQRLWGQNLSEAGIFLQTTRPFHPGDRLSLRFDVPGSEVHVRAAEVVWVKPFEPINVDGALPGIGVRFLSVDPPARAAIRRYVQAASTATNDDVPMPPPRVEVSEPYVLESLRPLSLPPFESLAPLAALEQTWADPGAAARASALHEAATLPPDHAALDENLESVERDEGVWSDADDTHDEHTEPDEHAILEAAADEHPLAGWRFEVIHAPAPELMPSPDAVTKKPRQVTLPPDPSFSLDDVRDSAPPFAVSLPPFELSGPQTPPKRLELSFDDEKHERGPDVLALAAHQKVDQDFFDGKLAVLELPQAEERGLDAQRTRRLRVAWAAGLLLAGGALGVVVGYEPAPQKTAAAPALETRVTMLPAPKPVAEAEQELFAAKAAPPPVEAPATERAAQQDSQKEQAPPAVAASTTTKPAAPAPAKEAPPASVPFVSPDEIATSASGKLPRKEDVSLTSAAPTASASASTTGSARVEGVRVEYGRITIPVEGGRVARSFGLASPPRVVVDLVDAEMPKQRSEDIGEKGVTRVRFGRPDPVHVRVVVELAGADAPTGITTLKKGSSLSVAWR